jgi:oligoendopeptidase F
MRHLVSNDLTQERDRSKIPERYLWNLADIYASVDVWRAAKDKVQADGPQLALSKNRLAESAATLADALDLFYRLDRELSRLFSYASMLADQDTRDARHQGMRQEMIQLATSIAAEASYMEPEILRFPGDTVPRFLAAEPRLAPYRFYLEDIARRAAHTLSDAEEKILADMTPVAISASNTFNIFQNADFPYPTITLSDGRSVKVDQAGYAAYRALPNRNDREAAMSAFFTSIGAFNRTFGTTIDGEVQKALFFAKTRKYKNALEMALDGPNVPVAVYTRLIEGVNRELPTFHRYLKLRKRIMEVEQLHYYDLYAPLVSSVDLSYSPEESEQHILASLAPLGTEYVDVVRRAFNERWIDLFPTEGKRAGAYSSGNAYDVHPYMLINYNGKYTDMSTVAHELGHTMQSYYSNKTQPYPLAGYPIFVAEVASTFNEALLIDYMLSHITDANVRLSLLGDYLEGIKSTVFRQTQFADFELQMHEMARNGRPITGETLSALYFDITKKYYGHDQGVTVVDDYVAHEWSYIPHFYREFYVFQYATSFTASAALVETVKTGDPAATARYLAFLSAGGSKYPIDLLKDAGVDMTTDEPLRLTMKQMNRVMDDIDTLLE